MGLFSFNQDIAIDLGTANTVITCNDKIVVDQPSVVALNSRTDELVAIGSQARQMHEKTPKNIYTVRPLRDGVIADFKAAELMIRGMIKLLPRQNRLFSPSLRIVVGIPSGSTEVEIRAVRDSSEHAGGREIYMIYEPMAAALGIGLDVEAPRGSMIVDIGGGTTEIAVISLGGLVTDKSIRTAGDELTHDIIDHMSRQHNVRIGERTAEEIKIKVGSALEELPSEEVPENFDVEVPNRITALPTKVSVTYQEIAHCLDKTIIKIEDAVHQALENTPAELYQDIVHDGIHLTGGGALLRGLAQRLERKFQIKFIVADDPLRAVARGTGVALKNVDKFKFLLR
ncbi:MAG: rod shape-determining protein [Bacteroidales bacterium]|nr:rod shape-determining protein [Bacteroidales bacterium]